MAGRTRGSLNKKTQDLYDLCTKERVNPFQALLKLCKHDDDTIRLQALKEACKYLYPQRKAIEMKQDEEQNGVESSLKREIIDQFKEIIRLKSNESKS